VTELSLYRYLFEVFAFVLGAVIGSFLNVCIYRLPLGLSVNEPKRSFCPHCKNQIPWTQNLPLISWLALRGKCAQCGGRIAFRSFGVELFTAVSFLGVWLKCQPPGPWLLAFPYWILVSLLIVATFIDLEHFIIPDEITWGGVVVGILLSLVIPSLMGAGDMISGFLWSSLGAALGYALLWCVVEAGKKAFGKRRVLFEKEEPFTWVRNADDAELQVGEDRMLWSDIYSRASDRMEMKCAEAKVEEKTFTNTTLVLYYDRLLVDGTETALDSLTAFSGTVSAILIPREAMGYGDVKFIAAIGAFLGWKAVLFSIVIGSVLGAVVGMAAILARRRAASAKIPFGPYLALGAMIWLFTGPQIVEWYLRIIAPPDF
jgi:leader peptidase (prepilin peptidase)/N-methyltransferase